MASCSSLKTLYKGGDGDDLVKSLKINEKVVIMTKENQKFELTIKEISDSEIIGYNRSVKIEDIRQIEAKRISALKTSGAVVGGYFASIYLLAVAFILAAA